MSIDGFMFEGRDVTALELKKGGMVYDVGTIQSALEAGCKTMPELLAHMERNRTRAIHRGLRAGAKTLRSLYG